MGKKLTWPQVFSRKMAWLGSRRFRWILGGVVVAAVAIIGVVQYINRPKPLPKVGPIAYWDPNVSRSILRDNYNHEISNGRYKNYDLGVSVAEPAGYKISLAERNDSPGKKYDGAIVKIVREDETIPFIMSLSRRETAVTSPVDYIRDVLLASGTREILEEPSTVTINGRETGKVVYRMGNLIWAQFVIVRDGSAYIVTGTGEERAYEASKGSLDQVLASMAFFTPSPPKTGEGPNAYTRVYTPK